MDAWDIKAVFDQLKDRKDTNPGALAALIYNQNNQGIIPELNPMDASLFLELKSKGLQFSIKETI